MSAPNVIEIERRLAHPPSAVWRFLTTPELHAQWWAAGDVKAEVGHRFELDMGQWGQQACEVLAVEPERLIRYRFATGLLDTIITWRLEPDGGDGARLILRHEGFNLDSPLGRTALAGMGAGWPDVLARLEAALGKP